MKLTSGTSLWATLISATAESIRSLSRALRVLVEILLISVTSTSKPRKKSSVNSSTESNGMLGEVTEVFERRIFDNGPVSRLILSMPFFI